MVGTLIDPESGQSLKVGGTVTGCVLVMLGCSWVSGGMGSPVWVFAPLLPVLAAFLSGTRASILTALALLTGLATLSSLPKLASDQPAEATRSWWVAIAVVSATALSVLSERQQMAAERRLAEAGRETLLAELAAKNDDLERFTYAVSHDLKSPMTAIYGFLRLLRQDLETGNSERIDHDIETIHRQVDRMAQLTDDLQELAEQPHRSEEVSESSSGSKN